MRDEKDERKSVWVGDKEREREREEWRKGERQAEKQRQKGERNRGRVISPKARNVVRKQCESPSLFSF